ncbi:unnamed protein product [Discosporangium mesarthrocarpum]
MGAAVSGKRASNGRPVFCLQYDAEEGMEPSTSEVAFVNGLLLTDLTEEADMPWKKEGEEFDQEALLRFMGDEPVDIWDVVQAQDALDAEEGGESTESLGMKELSKLPQHQQMSLATGFRQMADIVKANLAKLRDQRTPGEGEEHVVVSAEDVRRMFDEVRGAGRA